MPASAESVVRLPADVDLHARPAALLVRTAMGFNATVQVFADDRRADASPCWGCWGSAHGAARRCG